MIPVAVAERIVETELSFPIPEAMREVLPRKRHKPLSNVAENLLMFSTLVFLGLVLTCLHANILRTAYHADQLEKEALETQKEISQVQSRISQLTAVVALERLATQHHRKRVERHEIDDLTLPPHQWRRAVVPVEKGKTAKGRT